MTRKDTDVAGKMVEFSSNGGTCNGYLATPASGSGPGIIVLQEWWGLVDHIKDVADRFAAAGFVALLWGPQIMSRYLQVSGL